MPRNPSPGVARWGRAAPWGRDTGRFCEVRAWHAPCRPIVARARPGRRPGAGGEAAGAGGKAAGSRWEGCPPVPQGGDQVRLSEPPRRHRRRRRPGPCHCDQTVIERPIHLNGTDIVNPTGARRLQSNYRDISGGSRCVTSRRGRRAARHYETGWETDGRTLLPARDGRCVLHGGTTSSAIRVCGFWFTLVARACGLRVVHAKATGRCWEVRRAVDCLLCFDQ